AARSAQKIERGLSARRGDNRHAGARDRRFQQTALYRIVIDNKNCLGSHALHLSTRGDPRALVLKSGLTSRFATPDEATGSASARKIARQTASHGQGSVKSASCVNTFARLHARI